MPIIFYICLTLLIFCIAAIAYLLALDRYLIKEWHYLSVWKDNLVFPIRRGRYKGNYLIPVKGKWIVNFKLSIVGKINVMYQNYVIMPIAESEFMTRISYFKLGFPLNPRGVTILNIVNQEWIKNNGVDSSTMIILDEILKNMDDKDNFHECVKNWQSPGRQYFDEKWAFEGYKKYLSSRKYYCGRCNKNLMECNCNKNQLKIVCDLCNKNKDECSCEERNYLLSIMGQQRRVA